MCLAVPGEIVSIQDAETATPIARVNFAGIHRFIQLALVPEARVGDYVLCHVGCAIALIDAAQAAELLSLSGASRGTAEPLQGSVGRSEQAGEAIA
jgi:hydrogenase expression/formation protein HypC